MERRLVRGSWSLAMTLLAVAPALAQPSTVAPTPPPEGAPVTPPYPRALVLRPLLLPERFLEVGTSLLLTNSPGTYFQSYVGYAFPWFELGLGLNYQLSDLPRDDAHLATLYVNLTREIAPCYVPQLVAGVVTATGRPFGETPSVSSALYLQYKRAFANRVAIVPYASASYQYSQYAGELSPSEQSLHGISAQIAVTGQLQLSSLIAFAATGGLAYRHDLDDYRAFGFASHGSQLFAFELVMSMSPGVDLRASYGATVQGGSRTDASIVFGLLFRRAP